MLGTTIRRTGLSVLSTLWAVPSGIDSWVMQFLAELNSTPLVLYTGSQGYIRRCPNSGVVVIWDWSADSEVRHDWYSDADVGRKQLTATAEYFSVPVLNNTVTLQSMPNIRVGAKSTVQLVSAADYQKWVAGRLN